MKKEIEYKKFSVNGYKVYLVEKRDLESVSVNFVLKKGKFDEEPFLPGTIELLFKTIDKGTKKHKAFDIFDSLDRLGSSVDFSVSNDYSVVSLWSIRENFKKSFKIFHEILTEPIFPEDEVEKEKLRYATELKRIEDNPSSLASYMFEKIAFIGHPYGRKPGFNDVLNVKREDIVKLYSKLFLKENGFFIFSGNIKRKEVEEVLNEFEFEFSEKKEESIKEEFRIDYKPNLLYHIKKEEQNQFQIRLGYPLKLSLNDKNQIPLKILNYILGGGGFTTRLMKKVRAKKGLTYGIFSNFSLYKRGSLFTIRTFTREEGLEKTIELIYDEMKNLKENGVKKREVEFSKGYYKGRFPLQIETPQQIAGALLLIEVYSLKEDYLKKYEELIEKINLKEINEHSKKYILPENLFGVIVGPQTKTKNILDDKFEIVNV